MTDGVGSLSVRAATKDDDEAVLELLRRSLGWIPSEHDSAFFLWKHRQNPFGTSPAWLACVDDQIVGYRTMLRWRFERHDGCVEAVRAVDTATHPDHQGRGIFTKLTLAAIDQLRAESVGFVFNTPNDKSRPGYLKMGWHEVGRVPVSISLRRLQSIPRVARSMRPAVKWSEPTAVGVAAPDALHDSTPVKELLASLPRATRRHVAHVANARVPRVALWVPSARLPGRPTCHGVAGRLRRVPPSPAGHHP